MNFENAAPLPATGDVFWTVPEQWKQLQIEDYEDNDAFWDHLTEYESYKDVPLFERGFVCLGCAPGSGPAPFIVVHNDGKRLGFVHPYVTVVERKPANEAGKNSVVLKLNGDRLGDKAQIKQPPLQYKIEFATYETIRNCEKNYFCHNFGSFGNKALPDDDKQIIQLEWWEEELNHQ